MAEKEAIPDPLQESRERPQPFVAAIMNGAHIVRVHDVSVMKKQRP
jgi:hypothetical protein